MADVTKGAGRFAPSPTGPFHLGNLRTALAAWLFARSTGRAFHLRFEDLDGAVRPEHEASQLRDLEALGLDWDTEPMRQSDRLEVYAEALERLRADDLVFPCWCSRREIREATQAPNGPDGTLPYPGTCRHLSSTQRVERERAAGRPPSWRMRADGLVRGGLDVDDFVVARFDGTPAYNLVVVIDDAVQGVDQVVRADDLVPSTSRQLVVHDVLDLTPPSYVHVPLVLGPTGQRLAKRDGAVTLDDRLAAGDSIGDVIAWMTRTLGLPERRTATDALAAFDPALLGTEPTIFSGASLNRPSGSRPS